MATNRSIKFDKANAKRNDHKGINLQVFINIGDTFKYESDGLQKHHLYEIDSLNAKRTYETPQAITENS